MKTVVFACWLSFKAITSRLSYFIVNYFFHTGKQKFYGGVYSYNYIRAFNVINEIPNIIIVFYIPQ